ncbi:TPA: helix-turn-helix transcriptional regulator [Legionella pneumophila]|uniref:Phage transcriptional regulator AlpA n=1 Tax=Legionella pneumophila subsp. pneumophila TaxID=91891 RepID=A0AAV2USZ5_LEGPN|nr:AlpA family phage regulatory protein [Legionella pneumophila]MCK1850756.1 AlpA family phage regulatory protein [Legionella pneumophila]MDI9851317.1 AlpA family phage regulatory protein [Legionella pneumophila]MDW8855284.1 AlpA family phage regulatory protein [Legionella pneumophila]MDW8867811.1 AlpA family phage regulatory protein [Legionella pneumophila]MDW8922559.1 AlpA family phage regulatory protein [Legionella pneumophila]
MRYLPESGYLRIKDILGDPNSHPPIPAIIPIGKSTWWEGIKTGRFPKPLKFGSRISMWRVEDIRELIKNCNEQVK